MTGGVGGHGVEGHGVGGHGVGGHGVEDLVAVMDLLRSPGGCPWDAEQTHESLLRYAVEEVYEVVDAVEHGDRDHLREELGDLLLQVVFHARIAQEHPEDPFDLDDVAAGVADKLRRRHPHVFGDDVVSDAEDVHLRWERLKQEEKARSSVLDGIPSALPALARAQKVVGRVRRAGLEDAARDVALDEPSGGDATSHPTSHPTPGEPTPRDPELDLGARLLALAVEAEHRGLDAEAALRGAVADLEARARAAEESAAGDVGTMDPSPR